MSFEVCAAGLDGEGVGGWAQELLEAQIHYGKLGFAAHTNNQTNRQKRALPLQPGPGADVRGASPGADAAVASPVPVQMWP